MAAARSATAAPTATAPRQGTKIARVIELLQRDQGARLEELIAATGCLPHTARAALTGLRHRGYDVRLERGETGRASVYRAVATLAASA
jgi:DNA-binding IclR family transcriptional regulator